MPCLVISPTIVIERGPDFSHGSARSIPAFHITRALDRVAHLLERHGGHEAAAGFKIRTERLPQFREEMQAVAAAELSQQTLLPLLEIDAVVRLSDLDFGLLGILQQLEPCGQDNRSPVLLARNCKVLEARTVGGEGAHLKLILSDGGPPRDAIADGSGDGSAAVVGVGSTTVATAVGVAVGGVSVGVTRGVRVGPDAGVPAAAVAVSSGDAVAWSGRPAGEPRADALAGR